MAQNDNNDASRAHSPADVFATPPCHCRGAPTRPHRVRKGDDWLTVARYNNMSRAAAYRLCKTGDPSPPARGAARASVVKCTEEMVTSCGGCTEDGGHAAWDIG
ncbi:hypothetical protein GQ600_4380 [Phytophthora cactorum]|nr:hypothetical protein GQ600_4380 [Phytophthora cactorum]